MNEKVLDSSARTVRINRSAASHQREEGDTLGLNWTTFEDREVKTLPLVSNEASVLLTRDGNMVRASAQQTTRITERARNILRDLEVSEPRQRLVQKILASIEKAIARYSDFDFPSIALVRSEDQLSLVWSIGDTMLAFDVEDTSEESAWALLIGQNDRALKASGYLNEIDNDLLVSWLVSLLEMLKTRGQLG